MESSKSERRRWNAMRIRGTRAGQGLPGPASSNHAAGRLAAKGRGRRVDAARVERSRADIHGVAGPAGFRKFRVPGALAEKSFAAGPADSASAAVLAPHPAAVGE